MKRGTHRHRRNERNSAASSRLYAACEMLEARRMFATVTVNGTAGIDDITVDFIPGFMQVNVNGTVTSYADANVDRFDIFGFGQIDIIQIANTSDNVIMVDGGSGDDRIGIATVGSNLGRIDANVTVRGGLGHDLIAFDDSGVPAPGVGLSYDLVGNVFTRSPDSHPVTFFDVEEGIISCSQRDDWIFIKNDIPFTVLGNGGNDILSVGSWTGDLDLDNNALVTFEGNAGLDEARVQDWASAVNSTYVIDTYEIDTGIIEHITYVGRAGFGGLDTKTNERILLQASSGNNRVELNTVYGPGYSVDVRGNGGNDRLVLADRTGKLSDIPAQVNFDGGNAAEINTIELVDLGNLGAGSYAVSNSSIDFPGVGSMTYDDVSNIELDASTGVSTIDINSLDVGTDVVANGHQGADQFRLGNVGHQLSNILGRVTLDGGSDSDTLTLNDDLSSASVETLFGNTFATRAANFGTLNYTTTETVVYNGATGNDTLSLITSPGHPTMTINGNAGNDTFNIDPSGYGGFALHRAITLNGGGDFNMLSFNDQSSAFANSVGISATAISRSFSPTYSYSGINNISYYAGTNSEDIAIHGTPAGCTTFVYAGNGNDRFFIGGTILGLNLDTLDGFLTVHGQAGTDTVTFNDQNNTRNDNYTLSGLNLSRSFALGTTYQTVEGLTLNAASGSNTINVTTTTVTPVLINAANGADTINVNETANNGAVTVGPSSGDDTINVNPGGAGNALAFFNVTQRIGQLNVYNGGQASITAGGNKVLTMTGLACTGSGAFSVADNDAIVDYSGASPINALTGLLASGFHNGAWDGAGIRSFNAQLMGGLTGIGTAEAATVFGISGAQTEVWNGVSVNATCILLKYTYTGDANIDGIIDAADYGLIDNFAQFPGASGWYNGDFNYDGVIDAADYGYIDNNIQVQGPPL